MKKQTLIAESKNSNIADSPAVILYDAVKTYFGMECNKEVDSNDLDSFVQQKYNPFMYMFIRHYWDKDSGKAIIPYDRLCESIGVNGDTADEVIAKTIEALNRMSEQHLIDIKINPQYTRHYAEGRIDGIPVSIEFAVEEVQV